MQMRMRADNFPEHAVGKEAVSDAAGCLSEPLNFGCIPNWFGESRAQV